MQQLNQMNNNNMNQMSMSHQQGGLQNQNQQQQQQQFWLPRSTSSMSNMSSTSNTENNNANQPRLKPGTIGGGGAKEMDSLLEEMKSRRAMEQYQKETGGGNPNNMNQNQNNLLNSLSLGNANNQLTQGGGLTPTGRNSSNAPLNFDNIANPNEAPTTNLFIGNLPPDATEQTIAQTFQRFGNIISVKVMYPKGQSQQQNQQQDLSKLATRSGFVAYQTREEAESAKRQMDGQVWDGVVLKIGWGKSVNVQNISGSGLVASMAGLVGATGVSVGVNKPLVMGANLNLQQNNNNMNSMNSMNQNTMNQMNQIQQQNNNTMSMSQQNGGLVTQLGTGLGGIGGIQGQQLQSNALQQQMNIQAQQANQMNPMLNNSMTMSMNQNQKHGTIQGFHMQLRNGPPTASHSQSLRNLDPTTLPPNEIVRVQIPGIELDGPKKKNLKDGGEDNDGNDIKSPTDDNDKDNINSNENDLNDNDNKKQQQEVYFDADDPHREQRNAKKQARREARLLKQQQKEGASASASPGLGSSGSKSGTPSKDTKKQHHHDKEKNPFKQSASARRLQRRIDRLARLVATDGHVVEQSIMERVMQHRADMYQMKLLEWQNGLRAKGKTEAEITATPLPRIRHGFDFLFEHDSPENIYYRWRTYSLAQGCTLRQWRTEPFQIYTNYGSGPGLGPSSGLGSSGFNGGGRLWFPPRCEYEEARKRKEEERKKQSDQENEKKRLEQRNNQNNNKGGGGNQTDANGNLIKGANGGPFGSSNLSGHLGTDYLQMQRGISHRRTLSHQECTGLSEAINEKRLICTQLSIRNAMIYCLDMCSNIHLNGGNGNGNGNSMNTNTSHIVPEIVDLIVESTLNHRIKFPDSVEVMEKRVNAKLDREEKIRSLEKNIAKIQKQILNNLDNDDDAMNNENDSSKDNIALNKDLENYEKELNQIKLTKTNSISDYNYKGFSVFLSKLYLISDILHNSGSPHLKSGWSFRSEFERALPLIFEHIGTALSKNRQVELQERRLQAVKSSERLLVAKKNLSEDSDEIATLDGSSTKDEPNGTVTKTDQTDKTNGNDSNSDSTKPGDSDNNDDSNCPYKDITAEELRPKIREILSCWEQDHYFGQEFIRGLECCAFSQHPISSYKEIEKLQNDSTTTTSNSTLNNSNFCLPKWLYTKVRQWEDQHFSSLEKLCRSRGLPSHGLVSIQSTQQSKLNSSNNNNNNSMMMIWTTMAPQQKTAWLVDRLVNNELYYCQSQTVNNGRNNNTLLGASGQGTAGLLNQIKKQFSNLIDSIDGIGMDSINSRINSQTLSSDQILNDSNILSGMYNTQYYTDIPDREQFYAQVQQDKAASNAQNQDELDGDELTPEDWKRFPHQLSLFDDWDWMINRIEEQEQDDKRYYEMEQNGISMNKIKRHGLSNFLSNRTGKSDGSWGVVEDTRNLSNQNNGQQSSSSSSILTKMVSANSNSNSSNHNDLLTALSLNSDPSNESPLAGLFDAPNDNNNTNSNNNAYNSLLESLGFSGKTTSMMSDNSSLASVNSVNSIGTDSGAQQSQTDNSSVQEVDSYWKDWIDGNWKSSDDNTDSNENNEIQTGDLLNTVLQSENGAGVKDSDEDSYDREQRQKRRSRSLTSRDGKGPNTQTQSSQNQNQTKRQTQTHSQTVDTRNIRRKVEVQVESLREKCLDEGMTNSEADKKAERLRNELMKEIDDNNSGGGTKRSSGGVGRDSSRERHKKRKRK